MPRKAHIKEGEVLSTNEVLKRSLNSGLSGMSAMFIQVTSLMWMRTIMNTQYRRGGQIKDTVKKLYSEGGIRRFYRGYPVAIIQGPLSRFGDTFSNTLFLSLMNRSETTKNLPVIVKTIGASATASCFRILLLPVDATKTILQVEGAKGLEILKNKIAKNGIQVLYYGAFASISATFVGHFPWFATFNFLNSRIPKYENDEFKKLARNACIGFTASVVSDCVSNSLRVIKTTKQTYERAVTYPEVVKEIVDKEGILGLMGRGLKIRIMTNGIQGLMFSVLWRYFEERFNKNSSNKQQIKL